MIHIAKEAGFDSVQEYLERYVGVALNNWC